MYHWNSQKIEADLAAIPGISNVYNSGPGGDVDSDTLGLAVEDTGERLFVKGFLTDVFEKGYTIDNPADLDVEMVELTDGQCSSGGLNSELMETAQAFILVRAYFLNHGADVVDTLDVYF